MKRLLRGIRLFVYYCSPCLLGLAIVIGVNFQRVRDVQKIVIRQVCQQLDRQNVSNQPETVVPAQLQKIIKRMPPVRHYEKREVEFVDGQRIEHDLMVFATGFSYAVEHLKEVVDLDPDGRPLVKDCESTRAPGVFSAWVSFGRTFASPYLRGIARDAEYIVERIARKKGSK